MEVSKECHWLNQYYYGFWNSWNIVSCWNWAILQKYFCTKYEVYFKYTFGDILISKICNTLWK